MRVVDILASGLTAASCKSLIALWDKAKAKSLAIEPRASELAGFYVDSVCALGPHSPHSWTRGTG